MPVKEFPRIGSVQKAPCRMLGSQGKETIITPDTVHQELGPELMRAPGILHMGLLPRTDKKVRTSGPNIQERPS